MSKSEYKRLAAMTCGTTASGAKWDEYKAMQAKVAAAIEWIESHCEHEEWCAGLCWEGDCTCTLSDILDKLRV